MLAGLDDNVPFPVFDVEVRRRPNFDGDVIVLNLKEQDTDYDAISYSEFYDAVKKSSVN